MTATAMAMDTGAIELMARARRGQAEALGELCALYHNYMRAVARAGMGPKLRERLELSDVVQEALVEVVRQFPRFHGQTEDALAGWLRQLVGQRLADLGRYHSRLKRGAGEAPMSLDAAWGHGHGHGQDGATGGGRFGHNDGRGLIDFLASDDPGPSELASRRELAGRLGEALADLPRLEAEVLWLYHAEGLTFEAIGNRLGRGRKAVRAVWARGLKTLRRGLTPRPD